LDGFSSVIINIMSKSETLAFGLSVETHNDVKNVFHRNSS
jgi:hypothetical protein